MSNPQRLVVALVFVIALVGGGALALSLLGGGSSPASPSPAALTSPSIPASSQPAGSATPSGNATAPASVPASSGPSASAAATASLTPAPTVAPGRSTVVVVTALKLDAKDDPSGLNRKLTFRSQGSGMVSVAIRSLSPQGMTVMCLSADGERLACKTTAEGTLTATTTTKRADFALTLRGDGIATPQVEVTITFPARTPSITITNGRFDGTLYPDTNGLQLVLVPRDDGNVTVDAAWGGKPFNYEIDLLEQGGPGTQVLANQGPSTGAQATLPVTAGNPWKLLLQNINDGFGVTLLDATISWP